MAREMEQSDLPWLRRVLRSKFFVVCAILILIVMAYFLGRVIYKKYEVAQEIQAIKERRESLVKENQRLQDLLAYLKTDSYQERMARENLGLQQPGETVIAVEEQDSVIRTGEAFQPTGQAEPTASYRPIYRKWYDYFFASQ